MSESSRALFGRHLFLPFDTGWRRPGRLHPSETEPPSPPPPSPLLLVPNSSPPHTAPLFSPSCRRTAAVQQGRSDITASSRPIICFVYFKQHLLPGQRRTCWFSVLLFFAGTCHVVHNLCKKKQRSLNRRKISTSFFFTV